MVETSHSDAYDVIVVGGRPAGAVLAAYLGKRGWRTLLVERATFPCLPAVSSPIIYSSTMALLDEIGADEAAYAANTPRIRRMVQALAPEVQVAITIPDGRGRDYAYAIDRARFDHALWETALRYPSVDGLMGFSMTDLLWRDDDPASGLVVGIVGHGDDRIERRISARLVVGADGRFSTVARKAGAAVIEEDDAHPTSLYYAYWRGVSPYDADSPVAAAYAGVEPGYGYLLMDSADDTTAVVIEGQSALISAPAGGADDYYEDLLRRNPLVWARLQHAERITTVRGMRAVGNLYRQPGGAGWALVGDAYHQKDPLDGQGIYDAVFTAKALAYAVHDWLSGQKSWDDALAWYDETARIRTYGAFQAVLNRVRNTLYATGSGPQIPDWLAQTMARWMMDDPNMQRLLGNFFTRQIPAEALTLMTPPVIAGAMLRGGLRDVSQRVRQALDAR